MEQFSVDRSFYDISANDLKEFWDSDIDSTACDFKVADEEWNQDGSVNMKSQVILHDRLMTDAALGVTPIKTEHSYCSLSNDQTPSMSPKPKTKEEDESDEECLLPAIAPKNATVRCDSPPVSVVFVKTEPLSAPSSPAPETHAVVLSPSNFISTKSNIIERKREQKNYGQSILKQPAVTLTTKHAVKRKQGPSSIIKIEHPTPSGFSLPPTPPSSTSSDSEGNVSPVHSSSPTRRLFITSGNNIRQPIQTPLISSQPKGSTGTLLLTEEEKRTLLAEGYPIPVRLPLTKAEEKSLKKIRRKIKNKISAQESRRKKKEYMDALEKKVQVLSSENNEYRKKISVLEDNNTSLAKELSKLKTIIASYQGTGNLVRVNQKYM